MAWIRSWLTATKATVAIHSYRHWLMIMVEWERWPEPKKKRHNKRHIHTLLPHVEPSFVHPLELPENDRLERGGPVLGRCQHSEKNNQLKTVQWWLNDRWMSNWWSNYDSLKWIYMDKWWLIDGNMCWEPIVMDSDGVVVVNIDWSCLTKGSCLIFDGGWWC